MNLRAELVYKTHPRNAWLQFYAGYVTAELRSAILAAGWEAPEHRPPRLPDEILDRDIPTDVFVQPFGSELFGGSTEEEWRKNLATVREALLPFGLRLGQPRKAAFWELI